MNRRSKKRSKKYCNNSCIDCHCYENNKRILLQQHEKVCFVGILFAVLYFPLATSGFGTSFSSYVKGTGRLLNLASSQKQPYPRSSMKFLQLSMAPEDDDRSLATAGGARGKGDRTSIPEFDPSEKIEVKRKEKLNVGNPQILVKDKDLTVNDILLELAAIRQEGPQKYCILGTRHCTYLHQQIIELLAYALVLSGNHIFTSGAQGTNAAAVRGALRANQTDLLTVVLPQSLEKQDTESQELLEKVNDLIMFPERDEMTLEMASKLCNSFLLNLTDQLISFAFHESSTVIEAAEEAREQQKLVTMLYLD